MVHHKSGIKVQNNKEMGNMHNSLNLELFCKHSRKMNSREVVVKGEREDSLVPLFSPLSLRIVLLFHGCMSFCYEVSTLRVKHDLIVLHLVGGFLSKLGTFLEHSHQEILSHPILPSQKATLSIIPYHFTLLSTSQLLFYTTH